MLPVKLRPGMHVVIQKEPSTDAVVSTVAAPFAKTHFVSPPNYNELVLSLLHQAAAGGDTESQSKLGAMYAVGDGVPLDYAKAQSYLRKAADKNDALALCA